MAFLHARPIYKTVRIVEQKGGKANDGRQIRKVVHARRNPQHDENDIVGNVRKGIKGATEKQQGSGEHTRRYRNRADD